MALFQSEIKDSLRRLANREFTTGEERDELLARVSAAEELRARDIIWMIFRPDRAIRETGGRILAKRREPETLAVFLTEARGKAEAAFRAAASILFALNLPSLDVELTRLIGPQQKETKETGEIREVAKRLLLEAPPTATTAPVLWQFATTGKVEDRLPFLTRVASMPMDEKAVARWQRIAQEPEEAVRDKAVEVLATRAPMTSIPLLVRELPRVGYSIQQLVIEALAKAAGSQPPDFADQLLPLIASGEAGTRSAVMKILFGMRDRSEVVKRYIMFSKTLAGFVRDRALESILMFGNEVIEPTIELLGSPDDELRAAAIAVAAAFDDPRVVPATITLLKDPDWWIRISAAESLGRSKDSRAVEPLIASLADPDVRWSAVEALGRIGDPRALAPLGKMLGDPQPNVRIEVMQALLHFDHPQVAHALKQLATHDPDRTVRMRAIDLLEELAEKKGGAAEIAAIRDEALAARGKQGEPKLHAYLISTRNGAGSDFHLAVGQPPIVRTASELLRARADAFTPEDIEAMIREILTEGQWQRLQDEQQLDFCYFIPQAGRYRGNIFIDHRGYNAVFRVIPEKPPTISELGLPPQLAEIAGYHQGLVLVCGPSGSGKSTTLAALVNLFNETRSDHILTMEDPVEFVHPFKNSLVNQREVGTHTNSFARALRAALREDPDVIVIGELRDNESVSLALTAAETGHIVLGTLNSTSAAKAIDRLISSFPADEQPQIRASLSESLKYVIAQRLLPGKEPRQQVACFEILKGTSTIGNMIRDEKTYQIVSAMQIGRSQGMQTSDDALRDLLKRDRITPETAYLAAQKKEDFEALVTPEFIERGG